MSVYWSLSSNPAASLSARQSGTNAIITAGGWARVYHNPGYEYGNWTIWVTINGSKQSTTVTPYYDGNMFADIWDQDEFPSFSVTVPIPSNLLGTRISISFWAKHANEEESSSSAHAPTTYLQTVAPVYPSISWNSGSNVTASVTSNNQITATLNGGATIGGGATGTVYYRVWCDNTRKNSDGSTAKTWTFDPTAYDVALTIKVQAYFVYSGTTYTTSQLTTTITVNSGNYVNYYNGSSWIQCKVFYYNGSSWVECKPFYYNGSSWVEISS